MAEIGLCLLLVLSPTAAMPISADPNFGEIFNGIAQSLLQQEMDRTAYSEAQRVNTTRVYQTYLKNYPNGAYRINAAQALSKLDAPIAPRSAASQEATARLTRTQCIQIQVQLTKIGYPTGVADGLWGANTRKAIATWQTAHRLAATGYVTTRQVQMIAEQAGSDPVGPVAGDDPIEERLLNLTYTERRSVQRALSSLGYNTGGGDGVFGANTRKALARWQRDEGLRVTGYLTADQLRSLRRQSGQ